MEITLQWKQPVQFSMNEVVGVVTPTDACNGTEALILTGHGVTSAAGTWRMILPATVCPHLQPFKDNRPSFVAFPLGQGEPQPVVLSGSVHPGAIEVHSWKLGGGTAPNVSFSWHCVIPVH